MILNSLNNQFVISFSPNFFYPEIVEKWTPVVQRMKLPYNSLEDFINASIQSISFPEMNLAHVEQTQKHLQIAYRQPKDIEATMNRNLSLTMKLSEGFISYWILFEQIEYFHKYQESLPFWPPMYLSFLDHHGFELVAFSYEKIIPSSLSSLEISYATTAAEFKTFQFGIRYNRYKIKRRVDSKNYDITNES